MQRFANDKSIERKAKLGKYLTLAGFAALIGSLVLSFTQPQLANQLLIIAFSGTLLVQVGFLFTNRWGKHPRTDEILDQALKGLDSEYTLFHYLLGADHVLISPVGIYVLVPSIDDGEIRFRDGTWWQTRMRRGKAKDKKLKQLTTNARLEHRAFTKWVGKNLKAEDLPPSTPLLVFLHPDSTIHTKNASPDAVHFKKLKSYLRKQPRQSSIPESRLTELVELTGV